MNIGIFRNVEPVAPILHGNDRSDEDMMRCVPPNKRLIRKTRQHGIDFSDFDTPAKDVIGDIPQRRGRPAQQDDVIGPIVSVKHSF